MYENYLSRAAIGGARIDKIDIPIVGEIVQRIIYVNKSIIKGTTAYMGNDKPEDVSGGKTTKASGVGTRLYN